MRLLTPCYADIVTARTALALLGACSTFGCADVLGLGGLTFDQTASGGAASVSTGGSGGAEPTIGSGGITPSSGGIGGTQPGTGGKAPDFEDDYPVTWPTGAIVTVAWSGFGPEALDQNSAFWVYSAEAGTLLSHRLELLLPDRLGESSAPPNWDLAYAPDFEEGPWLFGYHVRTGLVDFGLAPSPGDAFSGSVAAGSPGWTHFTLTGDRRHPYLVAADAEARMVRIGPADPNTEDPLVTVVTWETAFTDLLAFRLGEIDGLLLLDSTLGSSAFVPIEDGMLGAATELELGLASGWTRAATFPSSRGAGLVVYYADTGQVETRLLGDDPEEFSSDDASWQRNVDAVVPVVGDGEARALTYDADTGVASLHDLVPLEPVVVVK
jgi:hypothetical protein